MRLIVVRYERSISGRRICDDERSGGAKVKENGYLGCLTNFSLVIIAPTSSSSSESGKNESPEIDDIPASTVSTAGSSTGRPLHSTPQSSLGSDDDAYDMIDIQETTMPVTMILKEPEWKDIQVDPFDVKYFNFFLAHCQQFIPYFEVFPAATGEIFGRSTQNVPLQNAILAISALVVDHTLQRPLTRALTFKEKAFRSLQQSLAIRKIDEDLAIAVFLMLVMDIFSGKETAQAHLRGFHLVLKELGVHTGGDGPLYWDKVSPVLMLLWRIALRFDGMIATIQDTVPVFPTFPTQYNSLNRKWALRLALDGRSADWGLAAFALDNFYQRACHYLKPFAHLRNTNYPYDPETDRIIGERLKELRREHAAWIREPSVAMAMQIEHLAQQGQIPDNIPRFLDYPPLLVHDRKFIFLVNEWRSVYAFITCIAVPLSWRRHTRTLINAAIDTCRTHAAIAGTLSPNSREFAPAFFAVLSAGFAFCGGVKFTKEFQWVRQRIERIISVRNPLLAKFQHYVDNVKDYNRVQPEWDEFDPEFEDSEM